MHPINRILTPFGFRFSRPNGRPQIEKIWNIALDYPLFPRVRWDKQRPNSFVKDILMRNLSSYRATLEDLQAYDQSVKNISVIQSEDSAEPRWRNNFIPVMDGYLLYSFVAKLKPNLFLEIGSGNSTKFVRRSIGDNQLQTEVISIDPVPRAEVDKICDELHRVPFEQADIQSLVEKLRPGDLVFFDGSHRCFQNSDVTVFFNEFLWQLPKGTIVAVHDIYLPFDYPTHWKERFYSEQYVLAAALIAGPEKFQLLMPAYFAYSQGLVNDTLSEVYSKTPADLDKAGTTFWFKVV